MIGAWLAQAWAHPATPSRVALDVGAREVAIYLDIPRDQLEMALSGTAIWDPTGPLPTDEKVSTYVAEHLTLRAGNVPLDVSAPRVGWVAVGGETFATVDATATSEGPIRDLVLRDDVVAERVRSHRSVVILRSDVGSGLEAEPRMLGTLSAMRRELSVPAEAAPSAARIAWVSARDGLTHVLGGADHLLFLWELLLVSSLSARSGRWEGRATRPLRGLLLTLSAFTLAHSVTLVSASLGLLDVRPSFVETWVALSLILAAAHLVRPLWPGREALFAGLMGLVHGAAFAEGLVGSGLTGRELAVPLVSFNLGIELAQLLVAGLTSPLWWGGAVDGSIRRLSAAAAVVLAGGWLAGVHLGWEPPAAWSVLSEHPLGAGGFAALLVAGRLWWRHDRPIQPSTHGVAHVVSSTGPHPPAVRVLR